MVNVLIIGATRGLGLALANTYASDASNHVYGTTRSAAGPAVAASPEEEEHKAHKTITWVPHIDLMQPNCGAALVNQLGTLGVGGGMVKGGIKGFDVVIITAGYFATEDFEKGPKWEEEVKMYTTSSIAPPFLVHSLFAAHLLPRHSLILLISSESGSIHLRHAHEGGGNYAHHASKAALNMVGRLLALDLEKHGVVVSIVHPGFMRTDMTRGVGFDQFWEDGGAVTPREAAGSLVRWVVETRAREDGGMGRSGEYWAPRGGRDIGTAEVTMGKDLPTPLQLPW